MNRKVIILTIVLLLVVTSVSYLDKNYFKKPFKMLPPILPEFKKYILEKEGGLSRSTIDTASSDVVPVPYKGKTGWHTNKGITWRTFKAYCKLVNIDPPPADVFFRMPEKVWDDIFMTLFYNPYKNLTKNDLFKCCVTWVIWGGGGLAFINKWLKENNAISIDQFIERVGKPAAFKSFIERRKVYYYRITLKNPSQKGNLRGWYRAIDEFYNRFKIYAETSYIV